MGNNAPGSFPNGPTTVTWTDGTEFDLGGEWDRVSMYPSLSEAAGVEITPATPMVELEALAARLEIEVAHPIRGKYVEELWEHFVKPSLVRPTFSAAQSWYDSLQTSLRLLPTRGLNLLASYTLGKATDHVSGLNIGGESRPVLPVVQGDEASIERALAAEKGPALFDARHRFVLSFGYELPRLEGSGPALRALAGGWQLNGIFQAQSGFPLSVNQGGVLDIRYQTSRPDVTCDPNDGPKTPAQYFNTSCFTTLSLAETGTRFGNAGRNTVRGPGFQSTDLSVFKNFDFLDHHRVQVRAEAFNVWNQVRFRQSNGVIGTGFGQISVAEDGRVVQLAVKYSF